MVSHSAAVLGSEPASTPKTKQFVSHYNNMRDKIAAAFLAEAAKHTPATSTLIKLDDDELIYKTAAVPSVVCQRMKK